MAKDPAFLFYPGDWLGGTMTFSRLHKGAYIDLLMCQFNGGRMSLQDVKTVLGESDFNEFWESKLKKKFKVDEQGFFYNEKLENETEKRKNFTESRRKSRLKGDEDSVRIYIVRDNVRLTYKIGSSVNPARRYNELSNQKSPAIMFDEANDRNIELLWYSEPTERKYEKEIHKMYDNKRITGEWFSLTAVEIDEIKSFFKKRTLHRTENENENIIINKGEKNKKYGNGKSDSEFSGSFKARPEEILAKGYRDNLAEAERERKENSKGKNL